MSEANLRLVIDRTLDEHVFSHQGRCVCGLYTGRDPMRVKEHLTDELTNAILRSTSAEAVWVLRRDGALEPTALTIEEAASILNQNPRLHLFVRTKNEG